MVVAASDTPVAQRACAKYFCDGSSDNVQIQAALDAAGGGDTVWLLPGTYNVTATLTQGAGILRGQGWGTVLNVSGIAVATNDAIVMAASGEIRDLKILGDISVLENNGRMLAAANNAVIDNIWISNNNYGIDLDGATGVTITNIRFNQIHSASTWAACIHAGPGADGITVDGITAENCDRGFEIEDGAQNVSASNGVMSLISAPAYSWVLDCHSHVGTGNTNNVTYENFVLTDCMGITAAGVGPGDRVSYVTFRNITMINPNLTGAYTTAVTLADVDHVVIDGIYISGIDPADALANSNTTDVVGLDTIVVT